ncbi:MAG TPA: helix-hairpin-helix domain-containing protein [Desulfuromonadales bacterium]|nr:helix-hairpin-helix domain-containing protein [Desulfuromonadales bacterium]
MKFFTKSALLAVALLLSSGLSFAVEAPAPALDVKGAATSVGNSVKAGAKADAALVKQDVKGKATNGKAAVKAKIVDINTASPAELKAIPGIGDAYSEKIIAGRPYANKAQLKSRNILPTNVYEQVKELIIAKAVKK